MSLIDNKDLETINAGSGYKFSATKLNKLGATEYTLSTLCMDASGSVSSYAAALEQALKTIRKAMDKSPRKDNLMLRLTQFNDNLTELHGFKLLGDIKESDYDNILNIGGMTALLDAVDEGIQTTSAYAKQLTANNFFVNAIVVVVTDGQNNAGSIYDAAQIKKSLEEARKSENLESITLILVGVTSDDNNLDAYLQKLVTDAGISQYTSIGKATPGKIAKLAAFVSQSISSTSAALGSGQPSIPINMTF
jgi:hypothetical protein